MQHDPLNLTSRLAPAVQALGYELVGVEYRAGKGDGLLRVYIDSPTGVGVDDCARVSHQVSGILDVDDPISGHYTLEVSSPGLDRPLFSAEHFRRFAGQRVKIQLAMPVNGRRRLAGVLLDCEGDKVRIDVDGDVMDVVLDQIDKARLVPDFSTPGPEGRQKDE